jgi:hypothetical protein
MAICWAGGTHGARFPLGAGGLGHGGVRCARHRTRGWPSRRQRPQAAGGEPRRSFPASPPPGTVGQPFAQNFFLSGGAAPYTWSLASGQLPPGLTLQTFSDPRDADNELAGSMSTPREGHDATLLPNGDVLVTAGVETAGVFSELYNPATGQWSAAAGGPSTRLLRCPAPSSTPLTAAPGAWGAPALRRRAHRAGDNPPAAQPSGCSRFVT